MTSKKIRAERIEVKILVSPGPLGFRYFWARRVTGFNSNAHCYSCLKGSPIPAVSKALSEGGECSIPALPDSIIYICGVAKPHNWVDNFHLAIRAKAGSTCERELHTGADLKVINGERIAFDDAAARRLFPDRGPDFLTCRNFQFAAQMFGGGSTRGGRCVIPGAVN
ncbi:MAG: hypothetical protein GC206_04010 [Alphaproteobacteria bacterium]|nr:hypothetical protein [Alphaproteobacteria bacterium]